MKSDLSRFIAKRPHGQRPFKAGDRIVWCGTRYTVLANFGNHGRVREAGENGVTIEKFYWEFEGECAVLDKPEPKAAALAAEPREIAILAPKIAPGATGKGTPLPTLGRHVVVIESGHSSDRLIQAFNRLSRK